MAQQVASLYARIGADLSGLTSGLASARSKLQSAGSAMMGIGAKITAGVTAPIVGIGVGAVKSAIKVESAFAGVIKTTEGLTDEYGNLNDAGKDLKRGFQDLALAIPVDVEELMGIGELGGQLGITRENLLDFTETMAAMGVSTNLTGEEAATAFAQIANIMGTPQDKIENMGSSVVDLGNNFATTEKDIVNFAQRIAGAGKIAGLTEADVFGISAAFSSVGIQAEAGGTATQKVLLAMNKSVALSDDKLATFAKTAGMSASDFAKMWEKDAGGAFAAFVTGLGDAGDGAMGILDDLELGDQRLIRSFLSLAGAGDLINDTMGRSAKAWAENTALSKEAAQRYATTESKLIMMKSALKDVAASFGDLLLPFLHQFLDVIRPAIDFVKNMTDGQKELALKIAGVLAVIGPLVTAFGAVATVVGALLSPIGLVIAAIALLAAAWIGNWGDIQDKVRAVIDWIAPKIQSFVDTIKALWTAHGDDIKGKANETWTGILNAVRGAIEWIAPKIQWFIDTIGGWWREHGDQTFLAAIKRWWEVHGETVMTVVDLIWDTIKTTFETVIGVIGGIVQAFLALLKGDWTTFGEEIRGIVDTIWTGIKKVFENYIAIITTVVGAIITSVKEKFTDTDWKQVGHNVIEGIKKGIEGGIEAIKNAARKVAEAALAAAKGFLGISSPSKVFAEMGLQIMAGWAKGIDMGEAKVLQKISKSVAKIIDAFSVLTKLSVGTAPNAAGFKAYLGQFRIMIDAMITMLDELERVVGYKRLKVLQKDSRKIQKMFEAVIQDFSAIKLYDLPDMGTWRAQFLLVATNVIQAIQSLATTFSSTGLAAAAEASSAISSIMGIVRSVVDSITAISDYEPIASVKDKIANACDRLKEIVPALQGVARQFELEGLTAAAGLLAAISQIVGVIRPAVDALTALADYKPIQYVRGRIESLVHDLSLIIPALVTLAGKFELEGIEAASAFARAAGGTVSIIKPAVDALIALADYEPIQYVRGRMASLAQDLAQIIPELQALASKFKIEGIEAASAFSQAASGIFGIIGPGIQAVLALLAYEGTTNIKDRAENLRDRLAEIITAISNIAGDFAIEGLEQAAAFAAAATTIIGIVSPTIQALIDLLKYEGGDVPAALALFRADLNILLTGLSDIGRDLSDEGLADAIVFRDAAEDVKTAITAGLDSISAIETAAGVGEGATSVLTLFADSVQTNLSRAVTHISDALSDIQIIFGTALQTLPRQAYNLGAQIGRELARGFAVSTGGLNLRAVTAGGGGGGGGTQITNNYNLQAVYPRYQDEMVLSNYVAALRLAS